MSRSQWWRLSFCSSLWLYWPGPRTLFEGDSQASLGLILEDLWVAIPQMERERLLLNNLLAQMVQPSYPQQGPVGIVGRGALLPKYPSHHFLHITRNQVKKSLSSFGEPDHDFSLGITNSSDNLKIIRSRDVEGTIMLSATVAEEEDSSLISRDRSQVSRYTPMATPTTNEMPFLHDVEDSGDLSLPTLLSSDARRPSLDSSLQETGSLMRVDSNLPEESPDPRGEAPAYFEVVDQESNPELPTTQPSSEQSETLPEPESQQRRSGFRTFLNRMSKMSHVPEHRRAESDQSSTSNGHRPSRSIQSHTSSHRPSQSGSGLSMFRTLSRQRSIQTLNSSVHLNSPSLISLNSISSPLSHTLVRTEFTYPKSGPTPEQLKVISSRENFSRFGVPYGADAIAFAASSSRQDLEPPPPDFEASSSQLSLGRPALSRRLDSSGSVVIGETRERPSISELVSEGEEADIEEAQPEIESEIAPLNASTDSTPSITYKESSTSPSMTPKVPDPISLTNPSSSSTSIHSHTVPSRLPPTNEFGKLYTSSLAPQDATISRSESRASNFSFQSYATAPESTYDNDVADSRPSTPRLRG